MKKHIITALVAGALSAAPVTGFAAPQAPAKTAPTAAHAAKPAAATHAMKGVVKSIDDKTLVVTRGGWRHADMSFALNDATRREGAVSPGDTVSVRYRDEGKTHVATAIGVEKASKPSARSTPSRH